MSSERVVKHKQLEFVPRGGGVILVSLTLVLTIFLPLTPVYGNLLKV